MKVARIRAVAFDLDGTLIDSRHDLAAAINLMRRELGMGALAVDAVLGMIGEGARNLVRRGLGGEPAEGLLGRALASFNRHYEGELQVGHGCAIAESSTLCAQTGLAGSTRVGRNVTFAGQAAAAGHVEIGYGALITGQAGATGDVPPGAQISGTPMMDRRAWARYSLLRGRLPQLFAPGIVSTGMDDLNAVFSAAGTDFSSL